MRIKLHSIDQAKKLAKRLKSISQNAGSDQLEKLSLAQSQHLVARLLGYENWQDLQLATTQPGEPSRDDREVAIDEMRARRRDQTEILRAEGYPEATAAAIVDALVPSGSPERERAAISERPENPVERAPAGLEEALGVYLHDASYRVALGDILYDRGLDRDFHGISKAHLILAERILLGFDPRRTRGRGAGTGTGTGGTGTASARQQYRVDYKGYVLVIIPGRDFYQGYFINDHGPDVREQILDTQRRGLSLIGRGEDPHAMSGALQASICHLAYEKPGSEVKLSAMADALAEHVGHPFFVVIGRHVGPDGYGTDIEVQRDVDSVDEARQRIDRHPDVQRVQRNLNRRYGLD